MKTTYYLVVWAAAVCVLIGSAHVNAAFVSVESASDGNGVFTYSVTKYSESYTLGGSDELFSFTLKAYQVIELFSPAGWTCTNTGNETYTWLCTNTAVSVIGTNALVFSLQSENEFSLNMAPRIWAMGIGVVVSLYFMVHEKTGGAS